MSAGSLQLVDLEKKFGDRAVVSGLNLTVREGEFLTMLGPSGSGKTTTLNMVAGFLSPTAGRIVLGDRDLTRLPPHRRDIGMVFQQYALFPHMTAFENVAFPLKQRRLASEEIAKRVNEALELVGLTSFAERYPRQLSGGQQQRVAFARAVVFRPAMLLMDEPLGALDRNLREALQLEIKRIHREIGATFLYVTHDQEEALALSDRIGLFNAGVLEQVGTAEDLYDHPATEFVARFMGDSNWFAGDIVQSDGTYRVRGEGFEALLPPDHVPEPDAQASLMVRPERLRLAAPGSVDGGANRLACRVVEVVYLGSSRKVELETDGGMRVHVREQTGDWMPLQVGQNAEVTWQPEDGVMVRKHRRRTEEES